MSDLPSSPASPFHAGEQHWQTRVGLREQVESIGQRVVRDHMPQQHQDFFALLPFVVVGTLDAQGRPWASALCGAPGFAHAPDAWHLRLDAAFLADDPAAAGWHAGAQVGLLGIQPPTRRRNRLNGTLAHLGTDGATVDVRQSFGNCPKYIRQRDAQALTPAQQQALPPLQPAMHEGHLTDTARAIVQSADTFFIASSSPRAQDSAGQLARGEGVDVSHRGGPPGFVSLHDAADVGTPPSLSWPDFVGNNMFNTLGNIEVQPWVGLLFMDPHTQGWLWLQGQAQVREEAHAQGTRRRTHVQVHTGWHRPAGGLVWGPLLAEPDTPGERT